RIWPPADCCQHRLGESTNLVRTACCYGLAALFGVLARRDHAITCGDESPLSADLLRSGDDDGCSQVVATGRQRGREIVLVDTSASEKLVTAGRPSKYDHFLAEDLVQPILLSDRLDTGQDRVMLVQEESPEIRKIRRTVEVNRI